MDTPTTPIIGATYRFQSGIEIRILRVTEKRFVYEYSNNPGKKHTAGLDRFARNVTYWGTKLVSQPEPEEPKTVFGQWQHETNARFCTFETVRDGETLTGELCFWSAGYFSTSVNEYPGFSHCEYTSRGKRETILGWALDALEVQKPGLSTAAEIAEKAAADGPKFRIVRG